MANRIRIKTLDNDDVHFDGCWGDQTLCGLEQDGDSAIRLEVGQKTRKKATCPDCIRIVTYCKRIKRVEIEL